MSFKSGPPKTKTFVLTRGTDKSQFFKMRMSKETKMLWLLTLFVFVTDLSKDINFCPEGWDRQNPFFQTEAKQRDKKCWGIFISLLLSLP